MRVWEAEREWYDSVPPTERWRNIEFRFSRGRGSAGEVDRRGIIKQPMRHRDGNKTAAKYRISSVWGAEDVHGGRAALGVEGQSREAQISNRNIQGLANNVRCIRRGTRAEWPLTRPSHSVEHTGKQRETAWRETAFASSISGAGWSDIAACLRGKGGAVIPIKRSRNIQFRHF